MTVFVFLIHTVAGTRDTEKREKQSSPANASDCFFVAQTKFIAHILGPGIHDPPRALCSARTRAYARPRTYHMKHEHTNGT
jgi:hypothetical protein